MQGPESGDFFDELSRLNNELVNLQRSLAKKNAQLANLNDFKNRFLGMAAHDLRSPIGQIIALSEFLIEETAGLLSDEHHGFLTTIRSAGRSMLQLVEDFLDVSVIAAGKLQLDRLAEDLVCLVRDNLERNRPVAARKGIRLSFSHEPGPLRLSLDGDKIHQVLNNLIGNAIKYSPCDSTVQVRVGRSPRAPRGDAPGGTSTSTATSTPTTALISVSDQGPGIPAEEQQRLFAMFERTSVRTTGGEKSSGLGLAIARAIVEAHRGRIWMESEVGVGTTIHVALPLDPPEDLPGPLAAKT